MESDRRKGPSPWAWVLAGAVVATSIAIWVMAALAATRVAGTGPSWLVNRSVVALTAVVEAGMGLLILRRHPGHRIGWILLWIALLGNQEAAGLLYSYHALEVSPGSLPGGNVAAWSQVLLPIFGYPLLLGLLPLLYPDGRLPSRRWRPAVWLLIAGPLMMLVGVFMADIYRLAPMESRRWAVDPFVASSPTLQAFGLGMSQFALVVLSAGLLVAMASAVSRYRNATRRVRLQLKWFAYFAVPVVVVNLVPLLLRDPARIQSLDVVAPYTVILWDVAIAIGILRHRLYDINLVISRTFVYGSLAVLIGAVYVAVVVGLGTLIGTNGRPNTALAILATTVVAVAFQPARERLQRFANRIVYGYRLTPLEAVTELGDSMSVADPDRVVQQISTVVAAATGARRAEVWLASGEVVARAATSVPAPSPDPVPAVTDLADAFPQATAAVPILDQGDLLGAIVVYEEAGDPLTPLEDALLANLARQAAHGLRNRVLTDALAARVAEVGRRAAALAEARRRVVEAHDAERQRLERDIHDGAQQHLVALAVRLGLARSQAKRNPAAASEAIQSLIQETARARADPVPAGPWGLSGGANCRRCGCGPGSRSRGQPHSGGGGRRDRPAFR